MKGYRTILANIAMALPLLADSAAQLFVAPELGHFIPAPYAPFYALGVVAVNLYLRTRTTTPVGKRY